MSTQAGLLWLDDDALLAIFSFLYGKDALSVALTSKRLHDLAIPRFAAVACCVYFQSFLPLYDYMLKGKQPRVQYLEDLTLLEVTRSTSSFTAARDAKDIATDVLIGDLITSAKNLRRLALSQLRWLLEDSRVGNAIATMPKLVVVSLHDVDGRTLELLSIMNGSLVELRLDYTWTAPQSAATDITLFDVLARHTRLQILQLRCFMPSADFRLTSFSVKAQFPSLRRLHIAETTNAAFDFPHFFPHLSILSFTLDHCTRPMPNLDDSLLWPPLQELYLERITLACCVQCRVGQVDKVGILWYLAPRDTRDLQEYLPAILRTASPITLALSVTYVSRVIGLLAPTLVALPRLRRLELSISLNRPDIEDDAETWLVALLALLSQLRLTSLVIAFTTVSPPFFDDPTSIVDRSEEESRESKRVQLECEKRRMKIACQPGTVSIGINVGGGLTKTEGWNF
ncbi:uncharacterized protein TRAVEDRAFT_64694 [Trametes versicolor FP-101664 SS1]|uniref:uncharacterized protein n=1 Tax=Trametes versicolor (strain FP-101664) TaxID=717944 RepID=UPI0004623EB0|nr:uncharacterized protein TRAVEDRAFT_64694 [Trametes versicolor FP-101664 SS1]EIW59892.1 hypothetical protein TRAVEDRAFT_64694 [Trametes versicolor FP-101664 SS1]